MDVADELLHALEESVGGANIVVDRELLAPFEVDYTGRWRGHALAVVAPASVDEVVAVLGACRRAGVGAVVQGGNTGLVGGAVPDGEVILLTRRLAVLDPVDRLAAQVTVGAGVTLERAQQHARSAGLSVPVDFASRSAATIGGMTATNAGGTLAVRYGTMASAVAGVEAVLGDGRVVTRLAGLLKDTAGYNLTQLLVGSEGTLAVITQVRLRLVRRPARQLVALAGFASLAQAVSCALALRDRLGHALEAADYVDALALALVRERTRLPAPFEADASDMLIFQVGGEEIESYLPTILEVLEDAGALAVSTADDTAGRERLWTYREAVNESIGAKGIVHKFDVSVPLGSIPDFASEAHQVIHSLNPTATTIIYGHLADGNLHINLFGESPDEHRIDEAIAHLVAQYNGSISAEHGIGIAKRDLMPLIRSADDISAMRAVKAALDPDGIIGRGRVLPDR